MNNQIPVLPEYKFDLFVARKNEINNVRSVLKELQAGRSPTERVKTFMGEKGTGKTWLLMHLETVISQEKLAHPIYINLGDYSEEDPIWAISTILKEIGRKVGVSQEIKDLTPSDVSQKVLERLRDFTTKERVVVLLVDHVFESDWGLLAYVDQYLLGPMMAEPRTSIVLAGRGRRYPWKTPELMRVDPAFLEPLDKDSIALLIQRQIPKPKATPEDVFEQTKGYPMQSYYLASFGFPQGLKIGVDYILEQVNENVRTKAREYLESLCVLESFDEESIKWLWAAYKGNETLKQMSHAQARAMREDVVYHGFAKWNENASGYVMDSSVRLSVGNALKHYDNQKWLALHRAAVDYVEYRKSKYKIPPELLEGLVRKPIEHHLREVWDAASKTMKLIGREEQLLQIEQAVKDRNHSYIVYVEGYGGVGKTRLIEELVNRLPEKHPDALIASEMIDLFHVVNRTDYGFSQQIGLVLDKEKRLLSRFWKARDAYLERQVLGYAEDPFKMLNALIVDINEVAQSRRIVLFLDTAEQFFYEDPAAIKAGLERTHLAGQGWILEIFLSQLQNVVVVIAGRTQQDEVKKRLRAAQDKGKMFKSIYLGGFGPNEVSEYFKQIREDVSGNLALIGLLQQIMPKQEKEIFEALHLSSIRGVRPLSLSLVIDYLFLYQVLPDLKKSPAIAGEPIKGVLDALFAADRPGTALLPYIGLLKMGADVELLARIMQNAKGEKKWDTVYVRAYLESETFPRLSFVKLHPGDARVYLHDVLDEWLEHEHFRLKEKEIVRVLEEVQHYYKEHIEEFEGEFNAFFTRNVKALPDPSEVERVRGELRRLYVEALHYRLSTPQKNIQEAFDTYFVAAEEALATANKPLVHMLAAELHQHVREQSDFWQTDLNDRPFDDVIAADSAVRWLKSEIAYGSSKEAEDIAKNIRIQEIVKEGDALAQHEWDMWLGLLKTYRGSRDDANRLLTSTQKELDPKARTLREKAILARTFNNLGYLARVQGKFHLAELYFKSALPLWRETRITTQEAYTRNNLAFVYAELGQFDSAWHMADDALKIRRPGGWVPIGLSWTTMAHIAVREGRPERGKELAERALEAFQVAEHFRGQGLAHIVLAESERRMTEELLNTTDIERFLRLAATHAEEGIKIFTAPVPEPARLIEAYIEAGCDFRDLAKYQRDYASEAEMQESAARSDDYLNKAVVLSEQQNITYRQVDALVNLAWLKYYIYQEDDAEKMLDEMSANKVLIPVNDPEKLRKQKTEKRVSPIIPLLGKMALLRGHIAYLDFEKQKDVESLRKAAEKYAEALIYDHVFSERSFRDLRRAKGRIYERLKVLNPNELRLVKDVAEEHKIRGNPLLLDLLKEYALIGK